MNRVFLKNGIVAAAALAALAYSAGLARADAFSAYALQRTFALPAGASSFDVLPDGRVVTMVNASVFAETAPGAGAFASLGALTGADVSAGPYATAFLRVSPDGTRIAVGNNGGAAYANSQVGVFALSDLAGQWFPAAHYDAAWIDDRQLALTAGTYGQPSRVTALDTLGSALSPVNPTLVDNIGGSSAGIAFDGAGNLFTGNGYDGPGASGTGWIKAFTPTDWQAALSGGAAADFEAGGVLVGDVLSAGALGFDADGNLHVGGGDFGDGQVDFGAVVHASSIAAALAGGGPVVASDPLAVRRLDPDADNPFNFYDVNFNAATGELYLREGTTVYAFVAPEPATAALLLLAASAVGARRRKERRA